MTRQENAVEIPDGYITRDTIAAFMAGIYESRTSQQHTGRLWSALYGWYTPYLQVPFACAICRLDSQACACKPAHRYKSGLLKQAGIKNHPWMVKVSDLTPLLAVLDNSKCHLPRMGGVYRLALADFIRSQTPSTPSSK